MGDAALDPFYCNRRAVQEDLRPGSLTGKVALITGSSAGIGASVAIELSLRGASVVLNYPDPKFESEALEVGRKLPSPWHAVCANLETTDGPQSLVDETVKKFGKIDILVNNAARVLMAPLEHTTLDMWATSMDVNARGAFLLTQAALPHLPKKDDSVPVAGRIINVISSAGREPEPMQSAYAASKAALDAMSKCWAVELPSKHNVTVNSVCPGVTLTPGSKVNMVDHIDFLKPLFEQRTPMEGWFALPEELAFAVAFLADPRSAFTNGAVINVSGGMFRS